MNLKELFKKEIANKLLKELKLKNVHEVPQLEKIVVNVGIGSYVQKYKKYDDVIDHVKLITGQQPVVKMSRIAISNFKLRKGMPVGVTATLRRKFMYDFFARLIHIIFPRIRDFRGFSTNCLDGNGNLNIGLKDYSPFPEIVEDDISKPHGFEITIVTSAKNNDEAISLFKSFGFPFKK